VRILGLYIHSLISEKHFEIEVERKEELERESLGLVARS